jgi:predicted DNA-binding transcriptional regulator AlpA
MNDLESEMLEDLLGEMPEQITERQASKKYGYSCAWFQKKRWEGGGPPYRKIGRSVRYPTKELAEWFSSFGLQRSTSEERVK